MILDVLLGDGFPVLDPFSDRLEELLKGMWLRRSKTRWAFGLCNLESLFDS